jgi:DUF1680 family protein
MASFLKKDCMKIYSTEINGYVGKKLDVVLETRILSDFARTRILPEAEQAFQNRVDDRLEPGAGMWQGEFWGKWILSAIQAHRYTGDNNLEETISESCKKIMQTQDKDGYIGTYSDSAFVCSKSGNNNWNIWCRKYTLWALVETFELVRDNKILEAASRFMDHLASQVGPGKTNIIDTGMFRGLASTSILFPVVRLYNLTGENRFLDYALYIVEQWSLHEGNPPDILNRGLSGKPVHEWFPNPETWTKAYEFISCVEGLVELYKINGEKQWLDCALNIHRNIRDYERTIFGGIGKNDKMIGARYLLETEAEICDAVYWQRLCAQLLSITGDPSYADEIERTLYNVLCTAMNREGSWGLRRICLDREHWVAPKHCNLEHHQCCVANLPRGLLQAAQFAVMPGDGGVLVNLYMPGHTRLSLTSGLNLGLIVQTGYPETGNVSIKVVPQEQREFTVSLRIPPWSGSSGIRINGKPEPDPEPGTYAQVRRTWNSGDQIDLELDMSARITRFPRGDLNDGGADYAAVERGPLVLARDMRLGDPAIHEPLELKGNLELVKIDPPKDIWQAFETAGSCTPPIRICDFSSAGNTWKKGSSDFRVWMPLIKK